MENRIENGSLDAPWTLLLAHGAGVPMHSAFMSALAEGISANGQVRVVRFDFPYMAEAQRSGKKRPPNGQAVLESSFKEQVEAVVGEGVSKSRLLIGGKSMGGRIASLLADDLGVAGLIVLGYPFHPPGKPEKLRAEHLAQLQTPTLICQGERDPFGTREQVGTYPLSPAIQMHWLTDGEHSFKPRKSSDLTEADNWCEAAEAVGRFVVELQRYTQG